jgi:hypothetical protein
MHDSDPYLGAIVHFHNGRGDACLAAIITRVNRDASPSVELTAFSAGGGWIVDDAVHMSDPDRDTRQCDNGTWHWRTECNGGDR